MTSIGYQRWIWTLTVLLIVAFLCTGYWFVRWGFLRVEVASGEEQTRMFEECLNQALQSSQPERIVGLMEAAIIYYPSGTKQTAGSHLDRMVERSRQQAVKDMIVHLRATTGADLGSNAQVWIDRYKEKTLLQSDGPTNVSQAIRSETNRTSPAVGSHRESLR
jgi:hypothetical protein